ncbi:LytR/AlgR family response regulator transcription factor [Marinicauda pacifica]|nr:LytTR family DNA-binding domain-containing protein [Marinicauda pacifica]
MVRILFTLGVERAMLECAVPASPAPIGERYGKSGKRAGGPGRSVDGSGMTWISHFFAVSLLFAAICGEAAARDGRDLHVDVRWDAVVTVCPARPGEAAPPTRAECEDRRLWQVDPQQRSLWLTLQVTVPPALIEAGRPLGLFFSGKAASAAYVNGRPVGQNGQPGFDRASEVAGFMDTVFYLPSGVLRAGENEIVMFMSGHHSRIHLDSPIHALAIGVYRDPTRAIAAHYLPALAIFGALAIGALYFAVVAARGLASAATGALAAAAGASAAQLILEALRGLWAYPYPVHDVRLVLITVLATLTGVMLALFAWSRVRDRGHLPVGCGALALAALVLPFAQGYDLKTFLGLLLPIVFAIGALAVQRRRDRRRAYVPAGMLLVFAGLLIVMPRHLLDIAFFQLMAGLLLVLFVQQAIFLAGLVQRRREEAGRARQLEAALANVGQARNPQRLQIAEAGRVELVDTRVIVHCRGAGDYVELLLEDGRTLLHDATLSGLEEKLPATFVRVHRSHIVNMSHIVSLDRAASGVGRLTLDNGDGVPVSRRVMPRVRDVLASTVSGRGPTA